MISFECDYNNGACQQVLDNLVRYNSAKPTPYGFDAFSERAKDRIREANRKMIETNSDVTAISNLSHRGDVLPGDTLYNLQGMRIASPVAGLNILHRADGTSMKFMFR